MSTPQQSVSSEINSTFKEIFKFSPARISSKINFIGVHKIEKSIRNVLNKLMNKAFSKIHHYSSDNKPNNPSKKIIGNYFNQSSGSPIRKSSSLANLINQLTPVAGNSKENGCNTSFLMKTLDNSIISNTKIPEFDYKSKKFKDDSFSTIMGINKKSVSSAIEFLKNI